TARLAGELAMSDTVETALLMRRMMVTGMSEPNAAAQPKAIGAAGERIEALDREIAALKTEMEMKRELSRNSVLTIIERDNERVGTNPMIQKTDNADSRFQKLDTPDAE
ncbi:integrating conjugative element protein, partial [Escherichia coli]|nr:integrating conjugative element protein [Escherichia coli]